MHNTQTVIPDVTQARLLEAYDHTAAGITPAAPFSAYSRHGLLQQYETLRRDLQLTAADMRQLDCRGLVAAYRTGHPLKGLGATITERLKQEPEEQARFELGIAAYYALPTRECLSVLQKLEPEGFCHAHHRDALASIMFHQNLLLHHTVDMPALQRWRISDELRDFLHCLLATDVLETEPSGFFSTLAATAAKLREPILPPLEPATRLVTLPEFRAFADTPAQDHFPKPEFLSDNHQPGPGEAVILVNANRTYFRKYADRFLASCGHVHCGQIVHLNLINDSLGADEIATLAAKHRIRLNVSRERFRAAKHVRRSYSALSRYIHLPTWLERYPLLAVSDIDGEIAGDCAALANLPRGGVALYSPPLKGADHPTLVWKNYHAGRALFHAPPAHIVRAVVGYCVHMFRKGMAEEMKLWHLDQLALALMVRAFPELPVSRAPKFFEQRKQA